MIEVSGLTKDYGKVRAVDDLNFAVTPGVVTGFLGPNGAGKSTTMRMILGLDAPTAGTATIAGRRYRDISRPLTKVGALLDAKAVHPNRSAAAHLRWIAQSNGLPLSRVDEVLGLVGLSDVAGKKAGGFSLGMGQRLGLAAALLGDPEVLVLDEPVNGLDPEGIRWVRGLLRSLAGEGRTVLVSSHMLAEMALTADHLIVIGRGRLVSESSMREFIRRHSETAVVLRTPVLPALKELLRAEGVGYRVDADAEGRQFVEVPGCSTEEIGALAFAGGIQLAELTQRTASLEDAYMRITQDSAQYRAGETHRSQEDDR